MVEVEVKLYSYHDMYLLALFKSGRISFPETARQVLNAYANKEAFKIELLDLDKEKVKSYASGKWKKYYRFKVSLDEEKDAAAINLLSQITDGCRNNFIKTLLMQYITCEIPDWYNIERDSSLFKEMSKKLNGKMEIKKVQKKRNPFFQKKTPEKIIIGKEDDEKPEVEKKEIVEEKVAVEEPTPELKPDVQESVQDDGFDVDSFLSGLNEMY